MSPTLDPPYGSCLVVRDRILARATLYYTERTNTEPLVVESRGVSRWSRTATFAIARLARHSFAFFHQQLTTTALTNKTVAARYVGRVYEDMFVR